MKKLFAAIRAGNVDVVESLLDTDPRRISSLATAPPKKDDGQSPLQVAIKSGQFPVAQLLLARGADVGFMDASPLTPWHMPVLHDSIRAAVFSTRFERNWALRGQTPVKEVMNTKARADEAFAVLQRLIELGADVGAVDSYGNPPLIRAALDARQVIEDPMSPDLEADLKRVFAALLDQGADPTFVDPKSGRSVFEILRSSADRLIRQGT